jgi:hypothetical protein
VSSLEAWPGVGGSTPKRRYIMPTRKKRQTSSHVTTDHDEIRQWVEERGGRPARVAGTGGGEDPGLLRIDYPGFSGEGTLEPISWDEFFDAFEDNQLAFVYQEQKKTGEPSTFSKLVRREAETVGSR